MSCNGGDLFAGAMMLTVLIIVSAFAYAAVKVALR